MDELFNEAYGDGRHHYNYNVHQQHVLTTTLSTAAAASAAVPAAPPAAAPATSSGTSLNDSRPNPSVVVGSAPRQQGPHYYHHAEQQQRRQSQIHANYSQGNTNDEPRHQHHRIMIQGKHHHQHHNHHHHHYHHQQQQQQPQAGQKNVGSHKSQRKTTNKHSVHWFRKDLRLSDNPALLKATKKCETWRCIFILDPWYAGSSNQGLNKWRFLLQCLDDLDQSLRKLNSRLFVVRGQPADVLNDLFKEWGTTHFTFEEDPEPYAKVRDGGIAAKCKEMGISVHVERSRTLYNSDRIIEYNDNTPPLTYAQFLKTVAKMKTPCKPYPALTARMLGKHCFTPILDDHDEKWGIPTLGELGFQSDLMKAMPWIGGETEALNRLERHLERKAWVASFGRPKMTPQSLLPSQTGLSPYLRFGCLSPKLFYHALRDLYKKVKNAEPPLSLYGQLLWREFFYAAASRNPNFDRMFGNPICLQIPWEKNLEALAKWASGKTGFPWIDAIMNQLRQEGWIHHLCRHAVACFLTRGHLWVSWEDGMKVFDELLLDADWSVNAGTWMWLSCSSFFQQFFHIYCPVRFGRKADPNGDFIRRYVPVLKNYPTRYIHEPWTAPEQVQIAAKCIVGVDYSKPMIDHVSAARINQARIKQVYSQLSSYRIHDPSSLGKLSVVPGEDEKDRHEQGPSQFTSSTSTFVEAVGGRSMELGSSQEKEQQPLALQNQETEGTRDRTMITNAGGEDDDDPIFGSARKQSGTCSNHESPPHEIDLLTPSIGSYDAQVIREAFTRADYLHSDQS